MDLDPFHPHAETFGRLAAAIARLEPACGATCLVAIDGPGGAGKSTFAARLASACGDAPVVHTDDFPTWQNQREWFPRFVQQVVEPLSQGQFARFRRYDWQTRALGDWCIVPPAPVVIVEGVSAGRRDVAPRISYVVWLETSPQRRLARGIERDGESMRSQWAAWMDDEDAHFAADGTKERADRIIDGDPTGSSPPRHEPATEFYCLGHRFTPT